LNFIQLIELFYKKIWANAKEGKKDKLRNIVLPVFAIICCLFMIFAAFYAHGIIPFKNAMEEGKFVFPILSYLVLFFIIMGIGVLLNIKKREK
jgi:amino acid transporter